MRLTADLIQNSLSYINPLTERELDLRGHKIPAVENLGAAKDNDCIDFTDNDIALLANFPLSLRLRSLLLARNRITNIHPELHKSIPNLTSLVLTQNRITELADLDALTGFGKLTHLVLLENPVVAKENYRYWVINRCPSVRFLDFAKVKDAERTKAKELFGPIDQPTALASKILSTKSLTAFILPSTNGAEPSSVISGDKQQRIKLTAKERERVGEMIKNAKSLQEIARLEKELNMGRIPDAMEM
ncbi:small nuclear ribonucleoprotein U2, A [Tothia fuscella]|uniref:U2 small nuclear ribonucleoprotein A' n=1 Tax=Tothia fuscella TaxID=1048955 RepID=A0A9P4NJC0_9PEZI|nr:small nuclear ribonucleoprotein U2, A [Tothia fuscella]